VLDEESNQTFGAVQENNRVFAAAVYSLWKMRNDRIFNNKRPNRRQLLTQVADLLKLWAYRSGNLSQEMRTWALQLQI
jgi:hypothetical protein